MLRRSYLLGLIVVLPLLVVLAALLIVGRRMPSLTQALNEYVEAQHLIDADNQLIWSITQDFVQGTQFENKVVINAPPQSDAINIYVLDEDPKGYFRDLECNCAYLGQENVIVCDAELLEYFRGLIEIPGGEEAALINPRFNSFLLQWIIGHEIGHLVLGHGKGKHHFQPPSSLPLLPRRQQPVAGITPQYEQEADTFVIEHLNPNRPDDQFWVWLGLSNVIGAMYNQTLNAWMDKSPLPEIELAYGPDMHPPWLIRLLDMAELLIDTYPSVVDESGYFEAVRKSIRLVSDGLPSPSLCEADVLPRNEPVPSAPDSSFDSYYSLHIRRGFEYWRLTEYDRAIMEFTSGIKLMVALMQEGYQPPPELLEAYLQRGVIYFVQGDYEKAIADWEAATDVQPDDGRAYNNLGFAYYELDRLHEAIAQWQLAVEADPFLDDAWGGLGIAFYAMEQTEEAIVAYQNALEIEPRYASLEWLRYERSWTEKSLRDAAALLALIEP
jgi:hypothetical protein